MDSRSNTVQSWLHHNQRYFTRSEYILLDYLLRSGRPVDTEVLMRKLGTKKRSTWIAITRLRRTLEKHKLGEIKSIRGVGYVLLIDGITDDVPYYGA